MTVDPAVEPSAQPDPAGVPPLISHIASGPGELTAQDEMTALDFFLGPTVALQYDLTVQYETPRGTLPLTVHFRQIDPSRFQAHDDANRRGDGPFAKLDVAGFNADVCADAFMYMTDGQKTIGVESEEFRGGMPGGASMAIAARFKYQAGLLEGIVEEIKKVAGYSPDRVGAAQRVYVEAGKGSSS